jgi:hypothetical protein
VSYYITHFISVHNEIFCSTSQVQRPGIEPIIYRDLFLFRTLASFLNGISLQKLGCNAELIVDEFGEKLLEELDYTLVSILVPFYFSVSFCAYLT